MADDGHVYAPQAELEPEAADILQLPAEKVTAVLESLETSELVRRETITYETADSRRPPTANGDGRRSRGASRLFAGALLFRDRIDATGANGSSSIRRAGSVGYAAAFRGWRHRSAAAGMAAAVYALTALQAAGRQRRPAPQADHPDRRAGHGQNDDHAYNLLDTLDATGHTYALASPTGRAAKRLTEATGREAKTIHRLLEFKPGEGFGRNESNPIDADLIVIDEASMLDLVLAYNLLKAIGSDSHLLLVGDVDQLPSVGAGDVLRDLIASGVAAVVRLETIFRQAANSLIIRNAHRINQGLCRNRKPDAGRTFSSSSRKTRPRRPTAGGHRRQAPRSSLASTRSTTSRCWRRCTTGRRA
jgi:hypothetical protein